MNKLVYLKPLLTAAALLGSGGAFAAKWTVVPETSTASGSEDITADRALSGRLRPSSEWANSAEMLYSVTTSAAPIRRP